MTLYEAFMDEMNKLALKYPPLGRTIKTPHIRQGKAEYLKGQRMLGGKARAGKALESERQMEASKLSPSAQKYLAGKGKKKARA